MARPAILPAGPGPQRLLAVHAHPDDETLATGIALAHHAARGVAVHVLTCTLGEEGEVVPPELAHLEGSDDLGPYRRGELAAAMAELGVEQEFLGGPQPRWRDSGMAGTPSAEHPRAFLHAPLDEAAGLVAEHLRRLRPDVVLTYDEHGGYGHPDHIRTHEVTVTAVRSLPTEQRPVLYAALTPRSWAREDRAWVREHVAASSGLVLPLPQDPFPPSVVDDDLVTHAVADPAAVPVRDAALRRHRTQVSVYDGYYALSNRVAARLVSREGYTRIDPDTGRPEGVS